MAHGIQTLGQLLAENSVDKRNGKPPRHPIPDEKAAAAMPMNRAEVRRMAKTYFPRDMRKQIFGAWRGRRFGGVS